MLIYLDMCCLKRPFDDQSQPRIRLEAEAVLTLLSMESTDLKFVRSAALMLENSFNPVRERASRVEQWLGAFPSGLPIDPKQLKDRTADLMALGLKNFDAFHIASAEQAKADIFTCCDDRLLAAAKRHSDRIQVRVMGIVECAKEFLK